jgi:hypothetical protein
MIQLEKIKYPTQLIKISILEKIKSSQLKLNTGN